MTVSGKSDILVFNLSFIVESGDYVSIFRSFRRNPPKNYPGFQRIFFSHRYWSRVNAKKKRRGEKHTTESLNGRKNMARRKVKNGEKSPWGQCLTRPVPNGRCRSAFWLGRKTQKVFWHQSEVRTAATVWNWSGKTLSPGALLAVLYFSSCHIFPTV